MKQQEKTQKTRERILAAAMKEFGIKSYESASINTICNQGQLSKGLVYHNFKSKDELYLQCVQICYDQMTQYMKNQTLDFQNPQKNLQKILELRQEFFSNHPYYANIFFNSVLQPPKHLLAEIQKIRQGFEEFYTECYRNMLRQFPLRKGITEDMALEYFSIFGEMFNEYFQRKTEQGSDYHTLIEDHEGKLSEILDIMLYGIADQKEGGESI